MSKEFYTDPISKMRDPRTVRMKQFTRKMNWDSISVIVFFAGVVSPIIFAFQYSSPAQLLKILFIPLSIGIAGIIFNFPNAGSLTSNVFWFIPAIIMLIIIAAINAMATIPSWYVLIVLAIVWIFWNTQRKIPELEKREWQLFKTNTGMADDEIKAILNSKKVETDPDA